MAGGLMKFSHILPAAFAVVLLAGCVDISKLQQIDVQTYTSISPGPQAATIKGSGDTSGGFLHETMASYLVAVDGKAVGGPGGLLDPVSIAPGVHSLVVAYRAFGGTASGRVPLMLDAEPGASYIVELENRGHRNLLTDNSDVTNNYLYLENEKTGLAATDKVTDTVRRNTNLYTEPAGDHLSTLKGAKYDELLGASYCSVMTIDGKYMPSAPGTPLLTLDHPDYDRAFKISPGRHAIGVDIRFKSIVGAYAFMLDVKPDTPYKMECQVELKKSNGVGVGVLSIWVEDTITNAYVLPPTDLPIGG
jgi:hypothetical protein